MKKIFLSVLCLFLVTLVPTLTLAQTKTSLQNKQQVLYVMLAKQGSIHEIVDKPGQFHLILKNVNPEIIYFADRPARFANYLNVKAFIQQWEKGSFKADPPNAVVEAIHLFNHGKIEHKRAINYAIVLKNPIYDSVKDELRFDIKRLPGDTRALPVLSHSDNLALFIDGSCLSCF